SLALDQATARRLEEITAACEDAMEDDSESIITNERYGYIAKLVGHCVKKGRSGLSLSDKIDRVVTNRWLALPIFAGIMFLVYYISIGTVGDWLAGFTNDTLFGEWICGNLGAALESAGTAPWLSGFIVDGIVNGVGAVIGFVPQMLVLFLMLCILDYVGYL